MAGLRTDRSSGITLFALFLSLVILGGVLIGERLTDTAQAATGDLGAWAATTPLAAATWAFAAAASPSYIYVSGGEISGGTNLTGTMRAAIASDGSLGAWQDQTLLSAARIDHGMVYTETAAGNRCLYVVGGYTSQSETVTTSVEYATVGSGGAVGNWTQTSAMNAPRAHLGLAAYGGRLYSLGGSSTGGSATSNVELASINNDCSLGAWQNATAMTSTHSGNRAFAGNGYLYSTGDMSDTLATGVQHAPINPNDGMLGAWASASPMGQKRGDHAVIANTRAGYVYALGGIATSPFTRTATVERAALNSNGTLGAWSLVGSLPSPSEDMAYAQAGGRVYMLGGSSGSITNTVLFGAIEGAGLPDLSASAKRVSSAGASPGQVLTYTIVLTNTGSGSASAMVTDTLPVSVAYVPGSATGAAGYVSATRAINWIGAVAAGSAVTISYSGVISTPLDNGTAITNTASINDGNGTVVETGPVTTTITSSPVLSGSAKVVDRGVATPGESITYTVVLSNTGNMNASARLTDTLPVSLTYVTGSATNGATYDTGSRSIRWAGTAAVGTPVSITYRAVITIPLDNGLLITNTATINDGVNAPFETGPVTTTISSSPDLSTSAKTVRRPISSPGGTIGYNVVVSNTGTMNTSARVTDTLPISLTYIARSLQSTMGTSVYDSDSGSILWAGPALVGVPVTISYQASVPASTASGTLVTNTATIQGAGAAARETSPVTVTVASNPSRIGWTNLGLYGVRPEHIAIDPDSGTVYLANGGTVGVYRSVTEGGTWLPSANVSICMRVLLDRSRGAVYASCRPGANNGGLWKSTDHGLTWAPVLDRTKEPAMLDGPLNAVANSGSTLFVADGNSPQVPTTGIWVSTDAGATWARRSTGQAGSVAGSVTAVAADASNAAVVYVATSAKVLRSADGGLNWTDITPPGGSDFQVLATSPITPSMVFAASGWSGGLEVYKSSNSGQSWSTVWTPTDPRATPITTITFHPTDPNKMYSEIGESTDAGDTWHFAQSGPGGRGGAIHPLNPSIMYSAYNPGVRRTSDGGATWTPVNTGLEEVAIWGVAENPRDPDNYLIASAMGFGSTLDNGANWAWPLDMSAMPQPDMFGDAVALEPSAGYLSGGDSIFGRSTDSGRTWSAGDLQQVVRNDLTLDYRPGVAELRLVPGETGHLLAGVREHSEGGHVPRGGVYESTDGGLTWRATGLTGVPVNSIDIGQAAGTTVVYAGVGDSWNNYTGAGGVYTTTIGNTSTWYQTHISSTAPLIMKVRVDPTNPLVAYAGGFFNQVQRRALVKTTDGGATWRDVIPVARDMVRALAVDPAFPGNVFYASGNTVYQSADGGATWSLFSEANLGAGWISALIVPLSAPSPVLTFTATPRDATNVLRWTNPSDTDFAGVTIKYSTQGFPMLSTEGITLTTAAGLAGATGVYTHTGAVTGTTYYYSAFAYNRAGRYSLPRQAAAQAGTSVSTPSAAELLPVRASAWPARRPATQASTRNLYAAAGGGLFARGIAGQTAIYLPALMKQLTPGW